MAEAFRLLFSGDPETWGIIGRSLSFSFFATLFSMIPGLPLGVFMARRAGRGRRALAAFVNALSALPTVVVGLFVYYFISRSGPLGFLGILFAPPGLVVGQFFLAMPLVASVTCAGLSKLDPRVGETLDTFGASPGLKLLETLREAKAAILSSLVLAFGRVIGEVGVSTMLGGNIRGYTRTMTTAIALDAAKGEFERAISFGLVLLAISVVVNLAVNGLGSHGR
jgi:tungstate transport system permease protein